MKALADTLNVATDPATAALEVSGLTKMYDQLKAVSELGFAVASGEIVGLVGPNGAGKTTTLRCISGIIPPTRGTVKIRGHDLVGAPVAAKQHLAFLPDEPKLFDYLTVQEHLNFTARLYNVADWETRARGLLDELELYEKRDKLPSELSRGMKQKLSIACGFLHTPSLILLDEPLTGLDPLAIRKMKQSIAQRARDGAAVVLSSHLLPLVQELCHRVLVIAGGQRIAYGSMEEIRAQVGAAAHGSSLEDLFIQITEVIAAERV